MIKVGQIKDVPDWGRLEVIKVAKLRQPKTIYNNKQEKVKFNPTLVQIQWQSDSRINFWLPYWITKKDKERYGQSAPMMIDEAALLELLREAIRQEFFSQGFLHQLNEVVTEKLGA